MPVVKKRPLPPTSQDRDSNTFALWDLEKETRTARQVQDSLCDRVSTLEEAVAANTEAVEDLTKSIKEAIETFKEWMDANSKGE